MSRLISDLQVTLNFISKTQPFLCGSHLMAFVIPLLCFPRFMFRFVCLSDFFICILINLFHSYKKIIIHFIKIIREYIDTFIFPIWSLLDGDCSHEIKRCLLLVRKVMTNLSSAQFSSVAQPCLTLCDPMNYSTPSLPVHHQLPEFTQTHVHWVSDAIQPSHPLSFPSPPAPNPSQHQGLFQWVNSLHEVAKALEFQLQHQSFQWTPRTDLL